MIPEDLEALALADSIGALDADEQRDLHARLATLPPDIQLQVGRLYDTALSVGGDVPQFDPPPDARLRLLTQIGAPARYTVTAQESDWTPTGLPGLTMRVLAIDRARGLATMLIRAEAGAVYPPHHHSAPEHCYVISGTVRVDGRTLGPGDFHYADADSDHGELMSPTGAEVLIVGGIEDYMPGHS